MAADESWHVHDIAPEIRETAREAARKRGISIDQWLKSVIVEAAAGGERPGAIRGREGAASAAATPPPADQSASLKLDQRLEELDEQLARLSRTSAGAGPSAPKLAASLRAIEKRLSTLGDAIPADAPTQKLLDVLGRLNGRLDAMTGKEPAAPEAVAQHPPQQDESSQASRLERALGLTPAGESGGLLTDDWATDLDQAIAEITARQRTLLGEFEANESVPDASPKDLAGGPAPAASGLVGLQERLGQLTEELRILRAPGGFSDAIENMRGELAGIAHKLAEAAPQRMIQPLEDEVRALIERFDQARRQTGDTAALAGVERSLDELCSAINAMAPAENLAAFRDEVRALDLKIEQAGAKGVDTGALPQLQRAVSELREIATHAATGDALIALAEEVQSLGDRLDRVASPQAFSEDLLANLDRRFEAMSKGLSGRGPTVTGPAADDLVSLIEVLSNKIDALEIGRESLPALDGIVAHLTRLAERVEASGARLDQLDQMEQSFALLLDRMDSLRADAVKAAERAAREAVSELPRRTSAPDADVQELRQYIDALTQTQQQSDQRTQDTLEAVHDTLERLVDRLSGIEAGFRDDEAPRSSSAQATAPLRRDSVLAPSISPFEPAPEPRARPLTTPPAPERRPIDPTLPGDFPLEPGAARIRATPSAAERIAASEAALGPAKPAATADAKANFIAAARRAAQAAATMSAAPDGTPEPVKAEPSVLSSLTQKITGRRTLMLGGVLLILAGTTQLVINGAGWLDRSSTSATKATEKALAAKVAALAIEKAPPVQADPAPSAVAELSSSGSPPPAKQLAPFDQAAPPALTEDKDNAAASPPRSVNPLTVPGVSPLTIASIQLPSGDVTGSLGRATGVPHKPGKTSAPSAFASAPPRATEATAPLPARLRNAAAAGDAGAEYEVASRFAEGRGVPPNLPEAARWFERAATRNLAPAQYRLGTMYEKGHGVKKDLDQARRLYRAAADAGNGKAMHNLAVLYAEGAEGKPDYGFAGHWFRKAAERGVADSQYNLAVLYARGLGIEQSLGESFKWFALAAQQGDKEAAKKRDEVAAKLDQATLAAASVAVQAFTPAVQPEQAVAVKAPAGGWDAEPAAATKPKAAPAPARKIGT